MPQKDQAGFALVFHRKIQSGSGVSRANGKEKPSSTSTATGSHQMKTMKQAAWSSNYKRRSCLVNNFPPQETSQATHHQQLFYKNKERAQQDMHHEDRILILSSPCILRNASTSQGTAFHPQPRAHNVCFVRIELPQVISCGVLTNTKTTHCPAQDRPGPQPRHLQYFPTQSMYCTRFHDPYLHDWCSSKPIPVYSTKKHLIRESKNSIPNRDDSGIRHGAASTSSC